MCLAWYMWVNGNYDILIMTITLIVVAGLVLEVVRLNRELKNLNSKAEYDFKSVERLFADVRKLEDLNNRLNHLDDAMELNLEILKKIRLKNEDQVKVNVHLAEDIARISDKLNQLKMTCDSWGIRKPGKKK